MKSEARTPNIRISRHAHEVLSEMAAQDNASLRAVLDKAIEHYRRERFLHAANADSLDKE
jgi:predicted HicB family RNase H-like nuclease